METLAEGDDGADEFIELLHASTAAALIENDVYGTGHAYDADAWGVIRGSENYTGSTGNGI